MLLSNHVWQLQYVIVREKSAKTETFQSAAFLAHAFLLLEGRRKRTSLERAHALSFLSLRTIQQLTTVRPGLFTSWYCNSFPLIGQLPWPAETFVQLSRLWAFRRGQPRAYCLAWKLISYPCFSHCSDYAELRSYFWECAKPKKNIYRTRCFHVISDFRSSPPSRTDLLPQNNGFVFYVRVRRQWPSNPRNVLREVFHGQHVEH